MPLVDKSWEPLNVHAVIAAYLEAERHRFTPEAYEKGGDPSLYAKDMHLIAHPDMQNPEENHRRLRLMYLIRGPMWTELPPDTQWFRVSGFGRAHLGELRIIARCGWDDPDKRDRNELPLAALRNPKILRDAPALWTSPILWGHSKTRPFTIVEGNNRLAGYVTAHDQPPLDISVIIGLSPTPFYYHFEDPPLMLADDLWGNLPHESQRPQSEALRPQTVTPAAGGAATPHLP